MPSRQTASRTEGTREALIAAGLHLFGHKGFGATTTREIAARAQANIAAIAYHFGGKDGLRMACGEHIAARLTGALAAASAAPPATPDAALERLEAVIAAVLRFMVQDEAEDIVAFMLREITEHGPVLDAIYGEVFAPRHRDLCRLWGLATGADPEAEETKLAVFAMIGQVAYFRIGRPVVLRRMGWDDMDGPRAERTAAILIRNLRASVTAARETS